MSNTNFRIESRDLSELDRLKTSLRSHDWNYIQDTLIDTNDACDRFFKDLTEQIKHFVPITSKTIPYAKLRREAWLTNGIPKSIQKEKRLYRQMIRKSRLPAETGLPVETRYKTYKTILQQVKRIAKQSYYYECCTQFKHNTKKLWETMNTAINKKQDKSTVIDELTVDGLSITRPHAIANSLGHYFANVGETYAKKFPTPKCSIDDYIKLIHENVNSLYFCPTTEKEIINIIPKLPSKVSSGYDKINNNLLKEIKQEIANPLTDLLNKSMSQGKFPKAMKMSKVVPLHKGKSREMPENYRPISLLFTISKVLKKLVYKRVYNYLHANGSIYNSQYDF